MKEVIGKKKNLWINRQLKQSLVAALIRIHFIYIQPAVVNYSWFDSEYSVWYRMCYWLLQGFTENMTQLITVPAAYKLNKCRWELSPILQLNYLCIPVDQPVQRCPDDFLENYTMLNDLKRREIKFFFPPDITFLDDNSNFNGNGSSKPH